MGKRFPHVRVRGDKALAERLLRRAKVELYRTRRLAAHMEVESYARQVRLSENTYIYTEVSPHGEYINIYADYVEGEGGEEEEFDLAVEVCPPAFLVYQRKYTEQMSLTTESWLLPKEQDAAGQYTVDIRDYIGDLIVYDRENKKWRKGRIIPEPEDDVIAYSGGWWGLEERLPDLYGGYKKCDLITWAGTQSSFMERSAFNAHFGLSFDRNLTSSQLDDFDCTALRPWFFFAGKRIPVVAPSAFFPTVFYVPLVLGACIIPNQDEEKDYFYVLAFRGSTLFNQSASWRASATTTFSRMVVLRRPVSDFNEALPWEEVAELYPQDVAGEQDLDNNTWPWPESTAYITPDGVLYILMTFELNKGYGNDWEDEVAEIDKGLVRIPLADPTAASVVEWEMERDPILVNDQSLQNKLNGVPVVEMVLNSPNKLEQEGQRVFSVNTPDEGRLFGMFGGLDKLYIYRLVLTGEGSGQEYAVVNWFERFGRTVVDSTFNQCWDPGHPGDPDRAINYRCVFPSDQNWRLNVSAYTKIEMVCFEGTDHTDLREIDRITLYEASHHETYEASRSWEAPIEFFKPVAGSTVNPTFTQPIIPGFINGEEIRYVNPGYLNFPTSSTEPYSLLLFSNHRMQNPTDIWQLPYPYFFNYQPISHECPVLAPTYGENWFHYPDPQYNQETGFIQRRASLTDDETYAGGAEGFMRSLYFHHPKIVGRWGFVEATFSVDDNSQTGTSTMRSFDGWQEIGLRTYELTADSAGGRWSPYNPPEIYFPRQFFHMPSVSVYGWETNSTFADSYTRHSEFRLDGWAKTHSLWFTGSTFVYTPSHLPLGYRNPPVAEPEIYMHATAPHALYVFGGHEITDVDANGASLYMNHDTNFLEGTNVEVWPYMWSATQQLIPHLTNPTTTNIRRFRPRFAVVHRPIEKDGEWCYLVSLPPVHIWPSDKRPDYDVSDGGLYSLHDLSHGYATWRTPFANAGVGYVDVASFYSTPFYQTGVAEAYVKPSGWYTKEAEALGLTAPEAKGVHDRRVYSNVLTVEEIQKLTGEDDDNIEGLGVL